MKSIRFLGFCGLVLCFSISMYGQRLPLHGEHLFVHNLSQYVSLSATVLKELYALASDNQQNPNVRSSVINRPLFDAFPQLRSKVSHVQLADLPTPIEVLPNFAQHLGFTHIYIKRDDLTGKILEGGSRLFGGNKIRKLEFLMADALFNGAQSVMTWGMSGSNHVVATAACADYLGLKCFAMLRAQHNSYTVRRNLALMNYYGAQLHMLTGKEIRDLASTYIFFKEKSDNGSYPYFIPTGGSTPVGVLGYVNAAFELKEQIKKGVMPEPDRIYVAAGTFGTIAGLLLGAKLAGLKSKIIGVGIEPVEFPEKFIQAIAKLYNETSHLLHGLDTAIPELIIKECDIDFLHEFGGSDYGLYTKEAIAAKKLLQEKEGIVLDGTYTAKAMAGMITDLQMNAKPNEVILFWHTFYSDSCEHVVENTDVSQLALAVQTFFIEPVQPLDM